MMKTFSQLNKLEKSHILKIHFCFRCHQGCYQVRTSEATKDSHNWSN